MTRDELEQKQSSHITEKVVEPRLGTYVSPASSTPEHATAGAQVSEGTILVKVEAAE